MKSLIRTTCFQSFREPAERAQLLIVLLCLCSMHARAQNVEGQIVASQYGEWKVPSIGIGFTFDPASCQLSGGGKNFAAFSNGTPIKVVDENPGLTEVSNATVYAHLDSSSCSVSLGGLAYGHTAFYLTSGTGGLQEALNNALIRVGGPNTIILNAEWYELVAPGNPATVIGAVTGGSGFGLVDVTTAPYTYYSWSGGHFNVVSGGGGAPTGPAGGSLSGTYPNPALSSTLVLPPSTTATTQSNGDNSTKLATTAYVAANSGGAPSGSAGGSLSGTYPNPALSSTLVLPPATTATTQSNGDNSTKVATTAYVAANSGGAPSGSAGGSLSGTYPNPALSSTLVLPPATTATTQSNGDNSTKLATTAYVAANSGGAPSGSAGGSLSGTYPNPGLSSTVAIPSGATATTQTAGDNSTKVATDAFVQANLPNVPVSSVFGRAGAVGASSGDYSVAQVTGAAPLASPALTGTPTAPTQSTSDTSTDIATDAFVHNNLAPYATVASPALTGAPTAPTQSCGSNTDIATGAYVANCASAITCTPSAHGVINGVSYTQCYTGSTFDVRVNAAMSDAESLANGNTTGIVDSTYEPHSVTQTGQITVGDGTHPVEWRLGGDLYSSVSLTGGTGYAVLQNPDTSIVCHAVQNSGCSFNSTSAANGIYALYGTNGNGYYRLDGVYFANRGSGSTLASGHVGIINGGYDGSLWANSQWEDTTSANPSDGAVVTITNVCCHSNFTNDQFDSEWGATALDLETPGHGINFQDNTFNTHGATASGNPNILCHDSGPGTNSGISFTGVTYMEGQAAAMTAPWIQDNGCQALAFTGNLDAGVKGGTGTTSPMIDVSSAFETTLNIGNVTAAANDGGTFTYPVTIVKQHNITSDCGSPPCNIAVTDSAGNSPGYVSRTAQFDNLAFGGSLTSTNTINNGSYGFGTGSGGDTTCPTPASGSSFLCTKNNGIAASINGGAYAALAGTQVYTVSTLPAASSLPAGTQLTVSDATTFTPGTCTGSGSDYMIAITNGSSWSCH